MKTTFETLDEAFDYGFRLVDQTTDVDISEQDSYGYEYRNSTGVETVSVLIQQMKNAGGFMGTFIPMFPPPTV